MFRQSISDAVRRRANRGKRQADSATADDVFIVGPSPYINEDRALAVVFFVETSAGVVDGAGLVAAVEQEGGLIASDLANATGVRVTFLGADRGVPVDIAPVAGQLSGGDIAAIVIVLSIAAIIVVAIAVVVVLVTRSRRRKYALHTAPAPGTEPGSFVRAKDNIYQQSSQHMVESAPVPMVETESEMFPATALVATNPSAIEQEAADRQLSGGGDRERGGLVEPKVDLTDSPKDTHF